MSTLALPLEAVAEDPPVAYYPIEPMPGDAMRRWVTDLSLIPSGFISNHFHWAIMRWDWFAEIYWFIEGIGGQIFGFYFEGSEDELLMTINGEMALEHSEEHVLSRIANRHEVLWSCCGYHAGKPCGTRVREADAFDQCCPLCGESLYLR